MHCINNIILTLLIIGWGNAGSYDLHCPDDINPIICNFLNRYINGLVEMDETDVSCMQKMRDDKFMILEGDLYNIRYITDSTDFSIVRYGYKAYEVTWQNDDKVLLKVAFPIQYELLLGLSQKEIELQMQNLISNTGDYHYERPAEMYLDSIAPLIYRTTPAQSYQVESLNDCQYFTKDENGNLSYVDDSSHIEYTIANLFQNGLSRDYDIDVCQNIYGFQKLNYKITLYQWLNYCLQSSLTTYVAIEEMTTDSIKVLVVAESKDLCYNHIFSVQLPSDFQKKQNPCFYAKLSAFIPTHNVADLYEQFVSKPKKQIQW